MLVIKRDVVFCLILTLFTLLSGCKTDDSLLESNDFLSTFSGLAAYNGIEDLKSVDFQVDHKTLNKDNESFSTAGYLSYRTVFPGERLIELISESKKAQVFSGNFDFQAGKFYSIFFYGKADNQAGVKFLLTSDSLLAPANGNVKVRFVNLVSDSDISINFQNNTESVKLNLKNQITSYKEINVQQMELRVNSWNPSTISYEPIIFEFVPVNKGVYTLVFYSQINSVSGKKELKHSIIKY